MARPSKIPVEVWARARAWYEADKSLREIEKLTGIEYSQVSKRAKAEDWQRGLLQQQIIDTVRLDTHLATLNLQQQEVIATEVDERTKYLKYFNDANLLHSDIALRKLKMDDVNISYAELNSSINVISKAQDGVMGKTPDMAVQIINEKPASVIVNAKEWLSDMASDINACRQAV